MALWLDEMVPRTVADLFHSRGYSVTHVRDLFTPGTADPIVAAAVNEQAAVIVTWDKDFRTLAGRNRRGVPRYPRMGLIHLACRPADAVQRLQKFIEIIELEYERSQARPDPRLLAHIGDGTFTLLC